MSTRNLPIDDPGSRMSTWRHSAHQRASYSLLITLMMLMLLIVACRGPTTATEQWLPPYLELHLRAGKARVQWPDGSGWTTMESSASIVIEETVRINADGVEGAQFRLGDGSMLELAPEATVRVENLRTFPRLQMTLHEGNLLFVAQAPSYEFVIPGGSATFLNVPSQIRIEVNGETTRLAVEEGAVTCALEEETFTLLTGWEMRVSSEEEPVVSEFGLATATTSPATPTPSPSPTGQEPEPTATPSPSPSPTLTPTPRRVLPTRTPTSLPPTDTPAPPPPAQPPEPPPPTEPPPTEPPPTKPLPTRPPPTEPPPTEPPPTEPRPTPGPPPTEPRPTAPPG